MKASAVPAKGNPKTLRRGRFPGRLHLELWLIDVELTLDRRRYRCESATASPDYRSQRSPSPEGSGHAKETWDEFHLVRARDLTEEAGAKPVRQAAGSPRTNATISSGR